jgi:hypothetical protein
MVDVTKVSLATRYLPLHIFQEPMGPARTNWICIASRSDHGDLHRDKGNGHHEDKEKEKI